MEQHMLQKCDKKENMEREDVELSRSVERQPEEAMMVDGETELVAGTSQESEKSAEVIIHKEQMVALLLHKKVKVYFLGRFDAKVVRGKVEILGYCLSANHNSWVSAFSPKTSHMLSIAKAQEEVVEEDFTEVPEELLQKLSAKLRATTTVLLLRNSTHTPIDFIHHFYPFIFNIKSCKLQGMCPEIIETLPCYFYGPNDELPYPLSLLNEPEEWKSIATSLKEATAASKQPRVVVCGGKGVGKSTLLRYLINSMLHSSASKVLLLDGDPQQSECSVSGGTSLNVIDEPLLGPHYSHIRTPIRQIHLGMTTVSKDSDRYMLSLKDLIEFLNSQEEYNNYPVFINTMGWSQGMEMFLLCDTIRLTKPTHVIQIDSIRNRAKNLPTMEPSLVMEHSGVSECLNFKNYETPISYELKVINSAAEVNATSKSDYPPLNRELSALAYLSGLGHKTPINYITPYCVGWKRLAIHVCHENIAPEDLMHTINGSLVALVKVKEEEIVKNRVPPGLKESPVAPCLGFGFIRGIDPLKRTYYILTPETLPVLKEVNCMLLGNLQFPDILRFSQKTRKRHSQLALLSGPTYKKKTYS